MEITNHTFFNKGEHMKNKSQSSKTKRSHPWPTDNFTWKRKTKSTPPRSSWRRLRTARRLFWTQEGAESVGQAQFVCRNLGDQSRGINFRGVRSLRDEHRADCAPQADSRYRQGRRQGDGQPHSWSDVQIGSCPLLLRHIQRKEKRNQASFA